MENKYHFKDPIIKLVGSYDGREKAWRHSRPHLKQDDPVMQDIQNLNLPVNGFAVYHFEITAPIIVRDLLYMIRPSNDWARSSRAEVITEDNVYYSSDFKEIFEGNSAPFAKISHRKSLDMSLPQDERKQYFLYAFMCDFSFMVNARVLSNLIYTLEGSVFDNYAQLFKAALGDIKLVPHDKFKMWNQLCLTNYTLNAFKSEIKEIDERVLVTVDSVTDLVTVTAKMKGNLSSQFQRQESGIVRSELINKIRDAKSIKDLPIAQYYEVVSQVTVSRDVALKIIRTRSDWFAQMDNNGLGSWSRIVAEMIKILNPDINDLIPCGKDYHKCPWLANQLNTIYGGNPNFKGDVNLPCPFITGIPEVYDLRVRKFGHASNMLAHWKKWIPKDLTLTGYGKQFLYNIEKYGYAEHADNSRLRKETEQMLNKYKGNY